MAIALNSNRIVFYFRENYRKDQNIDDPRIPVLSNELQWMQASDNAGKSDE
jgi:hypothetical protein